MSDASLDLLAVAEAEAKAAIPYTRYGLKSSKTVAQENEAKVLHAIARYGWLRSCDLARLLWSNLPAHTARKAAHRTCQRLLKSRLLIGRDDAMGRVAFLLSKRGVELVTSEGMPARHGADLGGTNAVAVFHRTLLNSYIISRDVAGFRVYTEMQMLAGLTPFARDALISYHARIPDGLVLSEPDEAGHSHVEWVEAENGYKPFEELSRVLDIAAAAGTPLCGIPSCQLAFVTFIVPKRSNKLADLRRAFRRKFADRSPADQAVLADRIYCAITEINHLGHVLSQELVCMSAILKLPDVAETEAELDEAGYYDLPASDVINDERDQASLHSLD